MNSHVALLWVSGSYRNLEDDLVHNAMRVIRRLALNPGTPMQKLARELAPSGKYEGFVQLLDLMKETNLIRKPDNARENILMLTAGSPYDQCSLPTEDNFDLNLLRSKYVQGAVNEEDKGLLGTFRDLHPFRMCFRVVWTKPRKSISSVGKQVAPDCLSQSMPDSIDISEDATAEAIETSLCLLNKRVGALHRRLQEALMRLDSVGKE